MGKAWFVYLFIVEQTQEQTQFASKNHDPGCITNHGVSATVDVYVSLQLSPSTWIRIQMRRSSAGPFFVFDE